MKTKSNKILQVLTAIYAALYLVSVVSSLIKGEISFVKPGDIMILLLFLLFLAGFALSWIKEKISGIILMVWNAGVWLYALLLFREPDGGMLCIMAVPVLVIGSLLLLRWYKNTSMVMPSEQQSWEFILRVLLINYAVLYMIIVISELVLGKPFDYFRLPFLLFPVLLVVFVAGFLLSWKNEFQAGIAFLIWYAILALGTVTYYEFRDSGPWILFGVPILLQGLFYITNNIRYRSRLK